MGKKPSKRARENALAKQRAKEAQAKADKRSRDITLAVVIAIIVVIVVATVLVVKSQSDKSQSGQSSQSSTQSTDISQSDEAQSEAD